MISKATALSFVSEMEKLSAVHIVPIKGNESTDFLTEERARIERLLNNTQRTMHDGPGVRQTLSGLTMGGAAVGALAGGPIGAAVGTAVGATGTALKVQLLHNRARRIDVVLASREKEKAAERIPGLPNKKKTTPIRATDKPQKWEVIRQVHPAVRAGLHEDLRIIDPHSGIAHSWATKKPWPKPGERIRLYQQPDHTAEYSRNYSGHILSGYGKTKPDSKGVQKVMHEKMHVHRSSEKLIRFDTGEGKDLQKFVFVKLKEREEEKAMHPTWTLINVTPKPENGAQKTP